MQTETTEVTAEKTETVRPVDVDLSALETRLPESAGWERRLVLDVLTRCVEVREAIGSGRPEREFNGLDPVLEIGQAASLTLPVEVQAGQSVLVEGDGVVRTYDAKGSQIRSVPLTGVLPKVQPGKNAVRFDCAFNGPTPPKVVVTVKTISAPTHVRRAK
jgi:hypothetical protein